MHQTLCIIYCWVIPGLTNLTRVVISHAVMPFLCCLEWPWEARSASQAGLCHGWHVYQSTKQSHCSFLQATTNYHLHTHLSTELTYFPRPNLHYSFITELGCRKMLKGDKKFFTPKSKKNPMRHFNYKFKKKRVHLHGFSGCHGRCYFWNDCSPSRGGKAVSGCTHTAGFSADISTAVHVPQDIPAPALQQIMHFTFPFTLTTQFQTHSAYTPFMPS